MYYELPNSLFYPNYLEVGLETLQITLISPLSALNIVHVVAHLEVWSPL